jgi:hypothetical protein
MVSKFLNKRITDGQSLIQAFTTEALKLTHILKLSAIVNWTGGGTVSAVTLPFSDVDTSTDEFTEVGHGFETGLALQVSTDGGLPNPLAVSTTYYVIKIDADTFQLATSLANANAGTQIDITTQGTGNHTFTPLALAGSLQLQISNSPNAGDAERQTDVVWINHGSPDAVASATGNLTYEEDATYLWARFVYTPTSGQGSINIEVCGKST